LAPVPWRKHKSYAGKGSLKLQREHEMSIYRAPPGSAFSAEALRFALPRFRFAAISLLAQTLHRVAQLSASGPEHSSAGWNQRLPTV
jgi:hypothetical protein